MELVQDSTECLQDDSLVSIEVRDRDMADGEEGGVT